MTAAPTDQGREQGATQGKPGPRHGDIGRSASRRPEQGRQAGPRRDQRTGVDADQQSREAQRRVGRGRLEGEIGRQVVDQIGAESPQPAHPQQCRPGLAMPRRDRQHTAEALIVGELDDQEQHADTQHELPGQQPPGQQVMLADGAAHHQDRRGHRGGQQHVDPQQEGRSEGAAHEHRHDQQPAMRNRLGRRPAIAATQGPAEDQGQDGHRDQDADRGRRPHHRSEPYVMVAREYAGREQIGEVGHRQEQRRRVGQPDRGVREQRSIQVQLAGQRQHDRSQQHRGGVQRQHSRRDHGDEDDQQPEPEDGTTRQPRRGPGHGGEHAEPVGEFRHHGDADQETQDRADPNASSPRCTRQL